MEKEEENYKDGKQDGKWVSYYENKRVEEQGNFKEGKRDGKLVFYYENGKIEKEIYYKDGRCVEMCEGDE